MKLTHLPEQIFVNTYNDPLANYVLGMMTVLWWEHDSFSVAISIRLI